MRVHVVRKTGERSARRYCFTTFDEVRGVLVVLESVIDEVLEPRKRKPTTCHIYDRLSASHTAPEYRKDEPDVPRDVLDDAIHAIHSGTYFTRWKDYRR
jgi:hypothetical protein